jgi:L-histidine N-alpha-methyltransferase
MNINQLPEHKDYQCEILHGLMKTQKSISPKFLYDERGSEIFEEICKLEEYYPVHAEHEILSNYAGEMAAVMGKNVMLIEPGCGNCVKVRELLKVLDTPKAYVALDISKEFLEKTTNQLQKDFDNVPIYPVVADYTLDFFLPEALANSTEKRVIFFPGSTIGNMNPHEAKNLLKRMSKLLNADDGLLIGVDMKKDAHILELAYDDPKGVTAEFNYNLLDRLNREFSGHFNRKNFHYLAHYNPHQGRVEMFLKSKISQSVKLGEETIELREKELIHTEDSYK